MYSKKDKYTINPIYIFLKDISQQKHMSKTQYMRVYKFHQLKVCYLPNNNSR